MIATDHLRLVPHTPEQLLALIEEPDRYEELAGFAAADGLRDFFVSGEVSPSYVERLLAAPGADPWLHGFAVVHSESRAAVGTAGFKGAPDPSGMVEIAYGIVPAFEGRGFATEAAKALVRFAFDDDAVKLVRAHTLPAVNASTRVLTKCGFTHRGEVIDPEDGLVWRWERDTPC
jgi:ribosomal-protein-alanine N-acetyltransferase